MNGVTFGTYHSYNDLSMLLNSKEIGSPEIKKRLVDVEGADGVLDYTEYFGEAKYSNRTLKFDFSAINQDDFMGFYSNVQDKLHGQKMQIILDDDTNHYYYGRIKVQPFTKERNICRLSIECDCDPYKLKASETSVSKTVSNTNTETALGNLLNMSGWQGGTSSGITYTVNSNGSIRMTGTTDEYGLWVTFTGNFPTLTSGQEYVYTVQNNQPEGFWSGISGNTQHSVDDLGNYVNFTADGEESFLYVWINSSTTVDYTFFPVLVHGSAAVLNNSRKHVVPTITTNAAMKFAFNNTYAAASAGTFKIPSIELKEGANIVVVNGSGTAVFKYREGRL